MLLKHKVSESLKFIGLIAKSSPKTAVVLGSGLGDFAHEIVNPTVISTKDIPHYPVSTVPGHNGQWIFGDIHKTPLLVIQGRVHYYEGYSLQEVTYYIHLLAGLGIKNLILTTACGALNPDFTAGDIMFITDQINFALNNPLIGKPENQLGSRFLDMSSPFDPELLQIAEDAANINNISYRKGVFCWVSGPNYETAAEVKALRRLGGSAVSMSTAPEVIVGRQRHLRILGISLITNLATGLSFEKLTHLDVTRIAQQTGQKMKMLLKEIIRQIALFDL